MKLLKENLRPLMLLLCIPIMSATYIIINKFSTDAFDITIALDHKIPLIEIFVIPYVFWYVFIPLSFIILCFKDKKAYYKTMLIYLLGYIFASIIFLSYQTTVPRTSATGDGLLASIVILIQKNDKPVNCLPSLHVFTSYLIIRAVLKSKIAGIKVNAITIITASLIIISTLFTKQHAILDVISGIVLAEILIYLVNRYEDKLIALWHRKISIYFEGKKLSELE